MGSLILCHKKRAKRPFEISRVHMRIYTIEELCYYICNNLYLIDYTIMNEKICEWLYSELDMKELARDLLDLLQKNGTIEQFVLRILEQAKIYSEPEMEHIRNVLDRSERSEGELSAENIKLITCWQVESTNRQSSFIFPFSRMRGMSPQASVFMEGIRLLGAAYGRELLYEQAAEMYLKAYEICQDETMLAAYVYARSRYLPEEEYQKFLAEHPDYAEIADRIRLLEEEKTAKESLETPQETLEAWKHQYRRYL